MSSTNPSGGQVGNLASPGARFGAYLLDLLLAVVTLGIGHFIWSIVLWQKGTTPAHQMLKLYVVNAKTGETASMGQMALRELVVKGILGGTVTWFTFGIYWLVDSLLIFGSQRKTLHDMISGTLVVQR